MNTSEEICYKWLREQGYKEEEILFTPNKSPDFICKDGKRYEAKKVYGRQILIYGTQIEALKDAIIVVVDTNKERVIRTFKFSDREKQKGIEIKVVNFKGDKIKVELKRDVVNRLIARKKVGDTYSDVIEELLDDVEKRGG